MRVLGRVRLSRASNESTSVERQRELIEQWAAANDHTIVGWAEDVDLSGSVDPWEAPSLGPWLQQPKLGDWDVLCAWKLDRLARRAVPLHKLFGFCQDEGKTLVCVSDSIDLSTWVGRLVASVIAGVAEGELEAIRERTKASQQKLREVGRWGGGKPAYGYKAVPKANGVGWELQPDEHTSKVVQQIITKALAGQSTESIATELTAAGEPTPSDHIRLRAGKPSKGLKWSNNTIRTLLRSKTLLGHSTHNGNTVRDDHGNPVLIGPPLVTQDQFDNLQTTLDGSSNKITNRSAKASPLLGVLKCGYCGRLMHLRQNHSKARGKTYRYYQCLGGGNAGGGGGNAEHETNILPADIAETLLEERFLQELGDEPEQIKVLIPAEDHTAELDEAVRAVDELTALLGTVTSDTMRTRLLAQLAALDTRISTLEKLPKREAGERYENANHTYREAWDTLDTEGRRQLLLRGGITLAISRPPGTQALDFTLHTPTDIRQRLAK